MPVTTVDVRELPARLGELLALAESGTEEIVTEGNTPKAKLVPVPTNLRRIAGMHPHAFQTAADFDAALPDTFWLGKS